MSLSVAKVASEPRPTLYSEHRAKGDPPVQSLREAELAMLSAGNYPAYLWAGYTMYGGTQSPGSDAVKRNQYFQIGRRTVMMF